ncbi:MAG: hypothetical protein JW891_06250 [Candidatus Lokiarchaeota archaeon]|nr:hypothetical protein [Candidatus Lokiarchaeota archaeon]
MRKEEQIDLHCPRCQGKALAIYEKSFDCLVCQLEFEKKDLSLFDDEEILSIEEKLAFANGLK